MPLPAICVVGPLPPPRHGASAVNEAMAEQFRAFGRRLEVVNTAPSSLESRWAVRLGRLGRYAAALPRLRRFCREEPGGVVYMSLSGGPGLLFEALVAGRVRRAGLGLWVHHHSFRYLDAAYRPMHWLVRAAGRGARHIVLGETMAEQLRLRYPEVTNLLVLSNAGLVGEPLPPGPAAPVRAPGAVLTVGYLSNLSAAKGLEDVIELARLAGAGSAPLRFRVAGPFSRPADAVRFEPQLRALANVELVGPVFGEAKEAFFRSVDAVVFPSRYRNEAEPLVVLEALRHGRPVIALGRGCVPAMLSEGGVVLPRDGGFAPAALAHLTKWAQEPAELARWQESARRRFAALHAQSRAALQSGLLSAGATPN